MPPVTVERSTRYVQAGRYVWSVKEIERRIADMERIEARLLRQRGTHPTTGGNAGIEARLFDVDEAIHTLRSAITGGSLIGSVYGGPSYTDSNVEGALRCLNHARCRDYVEDLTQDLCEQCRKDYFQLAATAGPQPASTTPHEPGDG